MGGNSGGGATSEASDGEGSQLGSGMGQMVGGTTIVTVVVGTWLGSMGRRCMPLLSGSVRRVEVDDVVSSRNQLG